MTLALGKFIVIEGLEGAGKSTAVATIVDVLAHHDVRCITTREPGGTAIGEQLRTIIKNPQYTNILDDKTELLLLYAARIQLLKEVIMPALHQGIWVIADRFELSTFAYQGGGRGLDVNLIKQLSAFVVADFKPNLTLYLDVAPEAGMQRARARGEMDRIEQQEIEFFKRVQQHYLELTRNEPNTVRIDAQQSLSEVQAQIKSAIIEFLA